jgi:hypothetical protein
MYSGVLPAMQARVPEDEELFGDLSLDFRRQLTDLLDGEALNFRRQQSEQKPGLPQHSFGSDLMSSPFEFRRQQTDSSVIRTALRNQLEKNFADALWTHFSRQTTNASVDSVDTMTTVSSLLGSASSQMSSSRLSQQTLSSLSGLNACQKEDQLTASSRLCAERLSALAGLSIDNKLVVPQVMPSVLPMPSSFLMAPPGLSQPAATVSATPHKAPCMAAGTGPAVMMAPPGSFHAALMNSTLQKVTAAPFSTVEADSPTEEERIVSLQGLTTVMMKHVPNKYSQRKLLREIISAGFQGNVDFIYLPMDPRTKANRGFAFCNLDTPAMAMRFFKVFHGKMLRSFDAEKCIEVSAAEIQGFEANAEHYLSAKALRRNTRDNYSRPMFLRPLPEHLYTTGLSSVIDPDSQVGLTPGNSSPFPAGQVLKQSATLVQRQVSKKIPARAGQEALVTRELPIPFVKQAATTMGGDVLSFEASSTASPRTTAGVSSSNSSSSEPRFCHSCGNERFVSHLFCPFCGVQAWQRFEV